MFASLRLLTSTVLNHRSSLTPGFAKDRAATCLLFARHWQWTYPAVTTLSACNLNILYNMKYWQGIHFGRLADFLGSQYKSTINLSLGYVDVITHMDQISNVTQMRPQDGNPCLPFVVRILCLARRLNMTMRP